MALSSVTYSGNGTTTSFAIPFPYLFQSDVSATVNGVTTAFTWTNPALIHFATAPINGSAVFIVRKTNITTLDVVFTDGSTVQASDINTAELQSLYLAQEANDGVSVAIAAAATATAATGAANAAAAAANAAVAGLVPFTGDSGTGGVRGLVPAPTAGSFSAGKFLSAGGSFLVPPGAGVGTNVVTAGADPTGVVDASAVFQTIFTAMGATGGLIVIPPGKYKIGTPVTMTIANGKAVSIFGYGQDVSVLNSPTGAGVFNITTVATSSSFHIRDLTFTSGAAGTGVAIAVNGSGNSAVPNDFTNITIRSADSINAGAFYFAIGINVIGVSSITFFNVSVLGNFAISGTGVALAGNTAIGGGAGAGIIYNFFGCQFNFLNVGIQYGNLIQGVTVASCNFTGGNVGIIQAGGSTANFQLSVVNSQIANILIGIQLNSGMSCVTIANNVFSPFTNNANWEGIAGLLTDASIIGNSFINGTGATNTNAIVTTSGSNGVIVSGNTFHNFLGGIFFQTGTTNASAQSNVYNSVTNPTSPAATTGTIKIGGGSA